MNVEAVVKDDYLVLIEVWEASVRATHDFLSEETIVELKPLILEQYFDAVHLHCVKDEAGAIIGFSGVQEGNVEMLFISPEARGSGVGASLLAHAVQKQNATKVDVNEQNTQALGFYEHLGFKVIGRSELDGQGRAYPLLHMALA